MVTVKEFLEKFEFVEGDCIRDYAINQIDARYLNSNHYASWSDYEVKFPLAWRENTGEMPCNGELLVDVKILNYSCDTEGRKASYWDWDIDIMSSITHWRPSIKNWIGGSEMLVTKKELDEALDELEKEEVMENQIEKAIREELVYEKDSQPFIYPTTAEGKRELADKLIKEAKKMEAQSIVEDFAKKTTREMLNDGLIHNDDLDYFYKAHVEFYKTLELF